jgi:hypothetical protein
MYPDGRVDRYKTATKEKQETNDLIVFVKFKDSEQMQRFLAGVQEREKSNTKVYVIDNKGNKYSKGSDIKGKDVRLALVETKTNKVLETVETKQEPTIGYNTYDESRYAEKGEQMRRQHLGNKVTKITIPTQPSTQKIEQTTTNNPAEYTNHSGGAIGSDTQWDVIGKEFGMVNNRHYFTGEKGPKNAPLGNVDITDQPIAVEGASKVAQAAKQMWGYKYNTMKDQRLIRNWAQVANSDAVFAIGTLGKEGDIWKGDEKSAEPRKLLKVAVQGGTGYAVEMAIQAGKPVYVFDQVRNQWYKNINGEWSKSEVPTLTKKFAGIGTREINEAGKQAIRDVYTNTFKGQPQAPVSTEQTPTTKTPEVGDVVEYKQNPYVLWNINDAGKAQLTAADGTKFSGTPDMNKLSYIKTLPKVEFNNKMFVVDSKDRIFSLSSGNEVYKNASERPQILAKVKSSTTQPSTSVKPDVKIISEDYGVVQAETNPNNIEKKADIDLIKEHISKQTFKENVGQYANEMFHYSLRWGRKSYNFFVLKDGKYIKSTLNDEGSQLYGKDRNGAFIKSNRTDKAAYNNGLLNPLDINSFAGKGDMYGYDLVDQNGNPLPSIKDLQPIIDKIEAAIGINMKDYDSVIGNIYLPGEYVYPHKDTSESKSARNYPVIVYSIGNDAGLGIVDNNEGKMTFANQYDERFLPANDKLKGYTNEILTKHGSIYTFGMDGKGRFELTHSTPTNSKKDKPQIPITLPSGKVVTNYTITLTFRRAADLEPGMPTAPAKISTQPQASMQQPTDGTEPGIMLKKQDMLKKINKAITDIKLDQLLAEKGYDVKDIISNLQAAKTQEDLNKINKILDKLC